MAKQWICPTCRGINPGKQNYCLGCNTRNPNFMTEEKLIKEINLDNRGKYLKLLVIGSVIVTFIIIAAIFIVIVASIISHSHLDFTPIFYIPLISLIGGLFIWAIFLALSGLMQASTPSSEKDKGIHINRWQSEGCFGPIMIFGFTGLTLIVVFGTGNYRMNTSVLFIIASILLVILSNILNLLPVLFMNTVSVIKKMVFYILLIPYTLITSTCPIIIADATIQALMDKQTQATEFDWCCNPLIILMNPIISIAIFLLPIIMLYKLIEKERGFVNNDIIKISK
jgi:MFS family permease